MDHFIAGLADSTTRDYLLHDCACRPLNWQETVQMAQACEASRIAQHAPVLAAAAASSNSSEPALDERTCTPAETTVVPAWQQSARDGRAKRGAHSSRRFSKYGPQARASATKLSKPQQNFAHSATSREPPPYSKSNAVDNTQRASG